MLYPDRFDAFIENKDENLSEGCSKSDETSAAISEVDENGNLGHGDAVDTASNSSPPPTRKYK
jgi:hypothetical protein